MADRITIAQLLNLRSRLPIIDVRTPAEFEQGHVLGAVNMPLFTNEERAVVGTLYKQVGQEAAILKGLEFIGPRMSQLAASCLALAPDREIIVHCWRGGMRSGSLAWLLETLGIKTHLLENGYKAYRAAVLEAFEQPRNLIVLGGMTGSGKTEILHELANMPVAVIDLEGIAHHKGSSFGALGQLPQPSTEQFENNLFEALIGLDASTPVWIEDESRSIGRNFLPNTFFSHMANAPLIFVSMPKHLRIERLVREYANFEKEFLHDAILRIERRLGGQHSKRALLAIEEGDFYTVADITLVYYDKAYMKGVNERNKDNIFHIELCNDDSRQNAQALLEFAQQKNLWKK